ncbi:MAG: hypothetical protein R3195_17440 [Gemmatimonadota bacterium]|nr:hypothetical protein [Gemmatimonadota bacterium]
MSVRRLAVLRVPLPPALAAATLFLSTGCAAEPETESRRTLGFVADIGEATAASYAEVDGSGVPQAIGLVFSANFFDELPTTVSDLHRCTDRNADGVVDRPAECNAWHEWVLPLPGEIATRSDIPFKWALLNWNPIGHIPPGVYDTPHFDMHFYIEPIEKVFAIEPGPCGPEFVRCDQFERATKPLPPNYVASDYQDVQAVAPAMGNHLIDMTSPELHGEPFTRTWIYGFYDGRITFYEEMVTRAYMLEQGAECFPIKAPEAVEIGGYYPASSCIRFDPESEEYSVSMEDFALREASPPQPLPEGSG